MVIFLRDPAGAIQGGLTGNMLGGWLHVRHLSITERLRYQGYGLILLRAAEEEAMAAGCRGAFLDTFSFQARPFYERTVTSALASCATIPRGIRTISTCRFVRRIAPRSQADRAGNKPPLPRVKTTIRWCVRSLSAATPQSLIALYALRCAILSVHLSRRV